MALLLDAGEVTADVARIFAGAGLGSQAALIVAESLVEADRLGLASHGVMLADMYVARLRAGSVSPETAPAVISDNGTNIVLDGRNGFGVLTADRAMERAVDRARELGAGIVAVRHAFHFGAARRFALAAAERGCLGIAMCNTRPLMPAPGGAERVVGNNPIAIAMPTADATPFVLDMATSEAAMGKIRMAAKSGGKIPATWAVRADGSPTTDPAEAIKGMLLPTAGPKGFGLALMIDLLCGVLSGGAVGQEVQPLYGDPSRPYDCSHLFIAVDVGRFVDPADAANRVRDAAQRIRSGARAPGAERLYTPGEPEWRRREDLGSQVAVEPSVQDALARLADALNVELTTIGKSIA
ncbi:Ldh family oxidoreductase [Nitratireductor pacificus]|uniref:Malate/L-lactate dehydrogenase n=1 Tax=Nitratireductor pacificus pht-3B TaxID=391937 RepID=K2ME53_9HYPH|nr:Ldh family oxidoreductase [Nitratireductor pacificus]EKF20461.1 malate/L-lactate dehydrogenase [Nitratireductor pacificus pht-3B]